MYLHSGKNKILHFSDDEDIVCEIWRNILLLTPGPIMKDVGRRTIDCINERIKHEVPVLFFVCEFTTTIEMNHCD